MIKRKPSRATFLQGVAVLAQITCSLPHKLPIGRVNAHESAIDRAFSKVKIRSNSAKPFSSASSSPVS
jgi:hypothetical protein